MADAASLHEIEPSPIEETPPTSHSTSSNSKSYFPPTAGPASNKSTATTRGLSGHHTPLYYLTRIHKYSTYAFTAFAAAHATNTSLIPLLTQSLPSSEPFLLLTRPYYQGVPFEPLLIIIPAYAHVLSGVAIRLYKRNLAARRYGDDTSLDGCGIRGLWSTKFWPAVSGTSQLGYALVPLLAGHAAINRVIPNSHPGGSSNVNLGYVAHAFARHPVVSYVGYGALIGVACWHFVWGGARWLGWTPGQVVGAASGEERVVRGKRRWYGVNAVAALVAGIWMAGGLGVIGRAGAAGGWVGKLYDEMYQQVPVVGRWM